MRNFKKILSLVLCMAMMLSVMVVGAGAAFSDQSKIKNTEAVDMCSALNIINGYTDGTFRPDGTITRAEACKMICIALNGGKEPVLGTSASASFTDTKGHWAEQYIESCVAQGIVAGVGGGKFAPNATVTGSQFAKMLLIALGYNADNEGYVGSAWEINVNVQATAKGLYEDLETMDPSVALTRDNAAQMVWNALQANEVTYEYTLVTENGQLVSKVTVEDKQVNGHTITLMADKYAAYDDESAKMTGFTYNSDKGEWTYYFETAIRNHASFVSSQDFTDLYLQNVKVVYTEKTNKSVDKVYGMYADDCVVLATAYVGDFDTVKDKDDEVTIADVDYDLEKTAAETYVYSFLYGNPDATGYAVEKQTLTAATEQANVAFEIVAIDSDDNGDIDFFVMYKFEVGQIASVGTKNFTTEDLSQTSFKFEDVVTYDGMDEDDFVVYTPAKYTATNDDTFAKVDAVLKGDVTAVKGDYEFAVDGTWYEATKELGVEAGDSIKDAPVVNGYVFAGDTTGTANIEDYALVIATDSNGYGYTAKLLFSDGTKKVVDTDKDYSEMANKQTNTNWLVTFEINSDDEYELTGAINDQKYNDNAESGFDYVEVLKALKDSDTNNSGKVKYIDGMSINDDAVIFMNDNGDYKVITGAQLKTIKGDSITQVVAYANDDSSTGYKSVEMAKVVTNADTVSGDTLYGYVTATPVTVRNADDKSVTQLTIWTEDGKEVTLNTNTNKASFAKTLEKGAFISFGINSDNEIDAIENAGVTAAAVTSYDGTYIAFNDDADRIEITDDTVIVYVDVEGPAGSDNGKIQLATKTGMDPDAKDYVKYYNNVAYKTNTAGDEIDVIFVDISNDIEDKI